MRPTTLILPFLALNLLIGVFTVATKNHYEVFPFTVYNLYSRISTTTSYETMLYKDVDGLQHNLTLEKTEHPILNVYQLYSKLKGEVHNHSKIAKKVRDYLQPTGAIYFIEVSGDSKALHLGILPSVDTLLIL